MAYSDTSRVVLISALVAVGLVGMALGCVSPNFGQLYNVCGDYVMPSASYQAEPSEACCKLLKGYDISCACNFVTKAMEAYVDPKKALYVAKECGITVKPGTKCGSKFKRST